MNIKRFSARDMRMAMHMIRESLGPDAVIIEATRTAEGVEVAAAVDYDATPEPMPAAPVTPQRPIAVGAQAELAYTAFARGAPGLADTHQSAAVSGAADDSVRCLLEARVSRLIWDDIRRSNPAMTNVMRNLSRLELSPDIVERLMSRAVDFAALDNSWTEPLKWLRDAIPVAADDQVMCGGVYAIAGPTGVGKTTTVAKLAARYALRNGADGIALVSMDNFRIGAREQLDTFARILGVPVYSVADPARLAQTLDSLHDARLVLIDTAGMSQRDSRMSGQLADLRQCALSILLTLPANAQAAAIQEIVTVFAPYKPDACILTKVDEAASLGGALSALIRSGIPLGYICDGQRVPEDLHLAATRMHWLLKTAIDCMRQHGTQLSKDDMAERFIQVAVNA